MDALLRFLESAVQPLAPDIERERCHGALLGLAVGNALGGPLEGWTAQSIRAFASEGIRDISPDEALRPWDDDVAQAIELARCLLEGFDADAFLQRLVRWADEGGRGMGRQTQAVLVRAKAGARAAEAAAAVWEKSGGVAAGNGAVMRCAPVALRWRRDPLRLIEQAGDSARVTHYDPRCLWSTVATCATIAHALAGTHMALDELADALAISEVPNEISQAARRATKGELVELELDEEHSMGYTVRTMTAGMWAYTNARDFEETLLEVINAGGDTDTNGAVAGAVLGARFGASAIPERWLDELFDPGSLEKLADQLWKAAASDG